MLRVEEHAVRGPELDQRTEVHHGHPVGDVAHHRQVVRDEEHRQAERLLQFAEQVDHLGLDGDVERGDRLVAHDELGFHDERAGDARCAGAGRRRTRGGSAMYVRRSGRRARATRTHDRGCRGSRGRCAARRPSATISPTVMARVQRRVRILEDHLHGARVALEVRGGVTLGQGLALVDHLARGLVVQTQHGLAEGGLAGSRSRRRGRRSRAGRCRGSRRRRRARSGCGRGRSAGVRPRISTRALTRRSRASVCVSP